MNISDELFERAGKVIPGGVNSPVRAFRSVGGTPFFTKKASGCKLITADDRELIDFVCAWGPAILGHDHPGIRDAVANALFEGTSFGTPGAREVEMAERIVRLVPSVEKVRMCNSGTEATMSAVRLARGYTGRSKIIKFSGCYHGHVDSLLVKAGSGALTFGNPDSAGIPDSFARETIVLSYNDEEAILATFEEAGEEIAGVILEPYPANCGLILPEDGYLQCLRTICNEYGSLLIFDEMITGFRIDLGGAQSRYSVVPDLACFGKAMANGLPLSTIVGRREVMELFDEVFFSFTFGGETLSLAAAIATIHEMQQSDVIPHLWGQGRKLKDGYNTLAKNFGVEKHTECIGLAPRTVITFKDEEGTGSLPLQSLFQQECLKRGVLFAAGHNLCYSHRDQDVDHTLRVYRTALEVLAQAIGEGDVMSRLEGKPIEPVFRKA